MARNCPEWLNTAVLYQVYPQSFYDSNGDGIGDLPGLFQKLDYIEWLGCNTIWMSPCYVSPFRDAGYDIADYYKVAPRYGTNADIKRLFREAAKRGIRICLDLVVGHTSVDHPWFVESCKPEKNKYTNRYIWTDTWLSFAHSQDMRFVAGYALRDGCFAVNFFHSQPALNFGFANPDPAQPWQLPTSHPDVKALRDEVKNIIRHWLDMGASGFRVDMAASLVKGDQSGKATSALWHEMRTMLDEEYPEAVLIAEWGDPPVSIRTGFHVDFLSPHVYPADTALFRAEDERNILSEMMSVEGGSFFDREGRGDICLFLDSYQRLYNQTRHRGYISIPTGNHDMARISVGRTRRELEVVYAFLMTMPGVPMVYYGDEIGMQYQRDLASKEGGYTRTGARTPMQWSRARNAGFSTAPADRLYVPVETRARFPNVESQQQDPKSLLNTVRRMIALRKATPCLCADGAFEVLYAKAKKYPFVYLRQHRSQRVLVALNPARKPVSVRFAVPRATGRNELLLGRGVTLNAAGTRYEANMDGISYGIFRV